MPSIFKSSCAFALLVLAFGFVSCGGDTGGGASGTSGGAGPLYAFVTNGLDPFWDIAKCGAQDAAKELGVRVDVLMPSEGATDQNQMLEDLITRGVSGVAVSPIAPENQTGLLNKLAGATKLITHDSDAPGSKRICYIGVDNYRAGRKCGKLVKEAVPDGGKVMLFVGRLEQANARLRRQGVIDELLGHEGYDPKRKIPVDEAVTVGKWTVLGTMTDQFDRSRAKSNCEDALTKHDDLACVIGLFAYNAPACLEAIRQMRRLGKLAVVSFDEDDRTLQGILDGEVHGTVVQDPYGYGYESVKMLTKLHAGDRSSVPESKIRYLDARAIRRAQVERFWSLKKKRLGKD